MSECECGCGTLVERRFVHGHNRRKPRRWTIEERGYVTACHVWQGAKTSSGYGAIRIGARTLPAHRVIYEEARGPVGALHMDHLCRVPACVRVDHLQPVTAVENTRRGESAILTKAQAIAIRERRSAGERGVDLAEEYGISQQVVCDIFKGRKWIADLLDL